MEGLRKGEASPGEFPWICTIYAIDPETKEKRFLGTCVIVPPFTDNTFPEGIAPQTDVVLTTKAKLRGINGADR